MAGRLWAALNKQVWRLSHKHYPCQDIQQVLLCNTVQPPRMAANYKQYWNILDRFDRFMTQQNELLTWWSRLIETFETFSLFLTHGIPWPHPPSPRHSCWSWYLDENGPGRHADAPGTPMTGPGPNEGWHPNKVEICWDCSPLKFQVWNNCKIIVK